MIVDPDFEDFATFAVLFELFLDQPEENERENTERGRSTINSTAATTTDPNTAQFTRFREDNKLPLSDRVAYLMKFPLFFQQAINSSDVEKLHDLCMDCCTQDLIVQPATVKEVVGIHASLDYFLSINKVLPDLVLKHRATKRYKRMISCKFCLDGTFFDGQDELPDKYNIFTQGSIDPLVTPEMRAMYQSYKAAGRPMHLRSHSTMFMILNESMTQIEKIIFYRRGLTLSDSAF